MDIYYSSFDQRVKSFAAENRLEFESAYAILTLRDSNDWSKEKEEILFKLNKNFSITKFQNTLKKLSLNFILDELNLY